MKSIFFINNRHVQIRDREKDNIFRVCMRVSDLAVVLRALFLLNIPRS